LEGDTNMKTILTASVIAWLGCSGCPGPAPTATSVKHDVVACVDLGEGVAKRLEDEILALGVMALSTSPDRWTQIEKRAVDDGLTIGGCAFARVINDWLTKKSLGGSDAAEQTRAARGAFEDYRSRYAGGSVFHTSQGDL
jgi:hypothetical protein